MLKRLVALLHLSLSDLVTSGGLQLPYLLFLMANLLASNFSCNSTQQLPGFPSRAEQRLSSKNITAKMVSHAIYVDASKAIGPDRIPAIVLMCYPEHSPVPAKLYNKCLAEFCFPSLEIFISCASF